MIGTIAAHYGWTYNYIMWGVAWVNLQAIMADEQRYEYNKSDKDKGITVNTLEKPEDIKNHLLTLTNKIK